MQEEIKVENSSGKDDLEKNADVVSKGEKFISIKDQSPVKSEAKAETKNMNMYLNKLNQNEKIVYSRLKRRLNKYKTDNKYPKKSIKFLD